MYFHEYLSIVYYDWHYNRSATTSVIDLQQLTQFKIAFDIVLEYRVVVFRTVSHDMGDYDSRQNSLNHVVNEKGFTTN